MLKSQGGAPGIPRRNNMDALRLIFASTVVVWHLFPLSHLAALEAPASATEWVNGTWAVRGFFVISGFLIFQSFESSRSGRSYFEKRARRIYPAYFAVVMICAIAGAFFTKLSLSAYFGRDWLSYVVNNLAFLNYRHPALPGVFTGNPETAVNGALWTIKVEVMFYASVPVLVWLFRKTQREIAIAVLYALSVAFYMYFSWKAVQTGRDSYDVLAKQLPGQLCFFLAGAVLYYNFGAFKKYQKYLVPVALVAYIAATILDFYPLLPISTGILVIAIAFGPYFGNAGRYGDFSYGIYIWHYPWIQLLVSLGVFAMNPYAGVAVLIAALGTSALLSWHFVEKPWLRKESHYRVVEGKGTAGYEAGVGALHEAKEQAPS